MLMRNVSEAMTDGSLCHNHVTAIYLLIFTILFFFFFFTEKPYSKPLEFNEVQSDCKEPCLF